MEYYILYISTADHLCSNEELSSLLIESRNWNYDHGITGMLIYVEGTFADSTSRNINSKTTGRFMQILEGSQEEVEFIFNKIKNDKRHFNVTPFEMAPSQTRYFDSWQMGFKALSLKDIQIDAAYYNPENLFHENSDLDIGHPLSFIKSFYARAENQNAFFNTSLNSQ